MDASYPHRGLGRVSIPVVKGSGQIAYGPVTVGGVVNYLTPAPPVKPTVNLRLTGGNRDYFNGQALAGGTWGGAAVLAEYMRKQGDGARDNLHSRVDDTNLKGVLALGSRHTLTLKGNYYGEGSQITYSGLTLAEGREPAPEPLRARRLRRLAARRLGPAYLAPRERERSHHPALRLALQPRLVAPVAAATAITGISSMALGIISPPTCTECSLRCRTRMSATGSPACSRLLCSVMSAPMAASTSMIPVRVGFTPTFLISRSDPGTMAAATMKNAADDMSAGMTSSPGARSAACPQDLRENRRPSRQHRRSGAGAQCGRGTCMARSPWSRPRRTSRRAAPLISPGRWRWCWNTRLPSPPAPHPGSPGGPAFLRSGLSEKPFAKAGKAVILHPEAHPPTWYSWAMIAAVPNLQRERAGFTERLGQYLSSPAPKKAYVLQVGKRTLNPAMVLLGFAVRSKEILLEKALSIPDGIATSPDGRWIAISNHNIHSVFMYENTPRLNRNAEPSCILGSLTYPHGLRFTPDGNFVLVADAGAPVVQIYAKGLDDWQGMRSPVATLRIMDHATFHKGHYNPQEGGPKGIDIDSNMQVLVVTSEHQKLAVFNVSMLLQKLAQPAAQRLPEGADGIRLTMGSYGQLSPQRQEK